MPESYVLFDDAGKFQAARVMSEADSALQLELDSGKRVKVKSGHVLLRFSDPQPAELLPRARALADEIDLDLAWEFAPEAEFHFSELAREYFSAGAGPEQQAAALLRLFDAPHYFRRLGKGQFRKAPEETVKAALAGIERKRQQAETIAAWAGELVAGSCPPPIREQLYKILFRPDKNAPEYKAVVEAARRSQRAPLELLKAAGAITSAYQFHWRRFLFEQFPKGTAFPPLPALPAPKGEALPLAAAAAFSIDDAATTEIDDALSVAGLGSGTVVLGIHIAAPGLAIAPGGAHDAAARERYSTVYMPGWKLTMLPEDVVASYTLQAGRECPALSLYARFDEATLELKSTETRIERVRVAANLRHHELDGVLTEASLTGQADAPYPFASELAFAFRLAQAWKAQRERVRGKPESFARPDYNFALEARDEGREPDGSERVSITTRQRGAPLDLIVAEAMIFANSHWGAWLDELNVPAIYRSQASLAPGIKVRMGTRAAPHAGIGVAQYAWCTSPLRRYVDLVNQWQLIACVRHGRTAALAAPFKPKDAALFAIVSGFDAAYAAYNDFQSAIERYWTLRWMEQNDVHELHAAVMANGLVRADALPLVFRALGADGLARGTRVAVRIAATDLLTLDIHASVASRLDEQAAPAEEAAADEGEDALAAGPLTLAIDVQEAGDAPPAEPAP
jgi:exoribonuclease-2